MAKAKKKKEKKKIFGENWGFVQIFMIFVIGCIIGVYYEQFLHLFKTGLWESRQGIIYGPFNPVYGLGFGMFVIFLGKNIKTRKWWLTFIYACLLGGIAEYATSWISTELFHAESWDYSDRLLNIGGRTTIPYMLFWGAGGSLFMFYIYPLFVKLINKIPYKVGKIAFPILVVFMILNMFISYSALIRQASRIQGNEPANAFSRFLDWHYNDEFLKKYYPNMVHRDVGSK